MKAFRIHEFAGPDGLRADDLPKPAPQAGQVLVRVGAVSLNFRDLLLVKGLYNKHYPLPGIPASDAAGEVVEVGPGVTRVKPGDRVAGTFMQAWHSGEITDAAGKSALGGALPGVLAEYVVLGQDGVVKIPDHLSFEEASSLPCAGVTAWHALVVEGKVKAGDTVLTQGTGGVSIFALQLARLCGARVIATSSSDAKLEKARALGASDGINYKTDPEWDARARELTGGAGVDHVVEVGGAGTLTRSIRAVRAGGRIALIGVLTGGAAEVNTVPLLMKNARVQGIFVGSRSMFEAMNRAISLHQLHPVIDRVFPFDQAVEAFRHLESGSHFGKVVIRA